MIHGIPNPYVLLGLGAFWIASVIGAGVFWGHHVSLTYEAQIAKQEATATTLLEKLNAANAEKDAKAAEYARDIETILQAKNDEIAANAAAAKSDIADSVRRLAQCRKSSSANLPAPAAHSSESADSAAGSKDRLLEGITERVVRLGKSANKLGALVDKECVPFALEHGR